MLVGSLVLSVGSSGSSLAYIMSMETFEQLLPPRLVDCFEVFLVT